MAQRSARAPRSRPTGSLVGEHVVRGNYSPEIRFALAQGQDFLRAGRADRRTRAPASGAVPVAWQPVADAARLFPDGDRRARGRHDRDVDVERGPGQPDGRSTISRPDEIARLLQQRVVLAPQTTQCTVPAEVAGGVQGASLMLNAFGPEANFSHPVRPGQRRRAAGRPNGRSSCAPAPPMSACSAWTSRR